MFNLIHTILLLCQYILLYDLFYFHFIKYQDVMNATICIWYFYDGLIICDRLCFMQPFTLSIDHPVSHSTFWSSKLLFIRITLSTSPMVFWWLYDLTWLRFRVFQRQFETFAIIWKLLIWINVGVLMLVWFLSTCKVNHMQFQSVSETWN